MSFTPTSIEVAEERVSGSPPARYRKGRQISNRIKTPRRYAFACNSCKQRKSRCDGTKPCCKTCSKTGAPCVYTSQAAEIELAQAQERIKVLESQLCSLKSCTHAPPPDENVENVSKRPKYGAGTIDHPVTAPSIPETNWSVVDLVESAEEFGGSTSRFHAAEEPAHASSKLEGNAAINSRLRREHRPVLRHGHELVESIWQPLLLTKNEHDLGLPPTLAFSLLDYYWAWQHPLHNCVHKPSFLMDLALGGQYCSQFLLFCIYSLAARHVTNDWPNYAEIDKGEPYLAQAKVLLLAELGEKKPKITTIQGLLTLSGRQCAVGKISEGWTYAGMAFHMLTDAGLHLSLQRQMLDSELTAAEVEIRRRVYMAAFTWDKTLSLCLGRPPLILNLPATLGELLDDSEDQETWTPPNFPMYPATPSYISTCFQHFCSLSGIVPSVFTTLSLASKGVLQPHLTDALHGRLLDWYNHLPTHLKLGDLDTNVCPPIHILSLNLLYHTLQILTMRSCMSPANKSETPRRAKQACVEQAEIMYKMILLCGTTFDWANTTYLVTYCVYTAATIDVSEMSSPSLAVRERAVVRLGVALRLLEGEVKQTPGLRSSIDILKRRLSNIPAVEDSRSTIRPQGISSATGSSPLTSEEREDDVLSTRDRAIQPHPDTSGLALQDEVDDFTESWNIGFDDLDVGFQPDSFAWAMDEGLYTV